MTTIAKLFYEHKISDYEDESPSTYLQDETSDSFGDSDTTDSSQGSILPAYNDVLTKNLEDGIFSVNLDKLQFDLEYLLSTIMLQRKSLRFRKLWLEDSTDDQDMQSNDDTQEISTNYCNGIKETNDLESSTETNDLEYSAEEFNESIRISALQAPRMSSAKKDSADRYWLGIEPLCGHISKDNVNFLDIMIKECSDKIEIDIPDLNEHYSSIWAEQVLDQEGFSSSNSDKEQMLSSILDGCLMLKPTKSKLTFLKQRLEKAFTKNMCSTKSNGGKQDRLIKDKFLGKLKHSFLSSHSKKKEKVFGKGDKVLPHLKQDIAQLELLNANNVMQLNTLKAIVLKDLDRLEVKSTLDNIDQEIQLLYKRIVYFKNDDEESINEPHFELSDDDRMAATKILEKRETVMKMYIELQPEIL